MSHRGQGRIRGDFIREEYWMAGIQQVAVPITGFEAPLSEVEQAIQAGMRKFAQTVMAPLGARLDGMSAAAAIAPESPYWQLFSEFAKLGLSLDALLQMPADERGRLLPLIYEELGAGDGGLAVSLGASMLPWLMMYATGKTALLQRYPEGSLIGCWGITEPDHGGDMLDFGRMCAQRGSDYGRPNCVVRSDGDEFVVEGQKSAWVSNGTVAQLCLLYAAFDDGSGEHKQCVVLVPLDAKGVSRGKPLEKMGQRALPQGEIFFDKVRVPADHLLAGTGQPYDEALHAVLSEANALMGSIWVGAARRAYELALDYAHQRKQGGVAIIEHQNVRYRLFHMMLKIEAARALNHRVLLFNATAPKAALQGSIATKITSTRTAFEVASDAIQIFGGNGVACEYPLEKLMRDARASMIEDGCNEMLAIKGGTLLIDRDRVREKSK
jgi:acyl-CoA dehydrogenase